MKLNICQEVSNESQQKASNWAFTPYSASPKAEAEISSVESFSAKGVAIAYRLGLVSERSKRIIAASRVRPLIS